MTSSSPYDHAFFDHIGDGSRRSAERIVPLVLSLLDVRSVVDVGCGEGSWLAEFRRNGTEEVLGLDGDYVPEDVLKIPVSAFRRCDLRSPIQVTREFDLAMSLETAEHLPESRAESFVADITQLSAQVLFSAAIPFQRGMHHVNCQWPDYWQRLFEAHGYLAFDVIRPEVWNDDTVEFWYGQNTILYVRRDKAEQNSALAASLAMAEGRLKRLVHPALCDTWDAYSVRELLTMFPPAVKRAIGRRWRAQTA